jgi:beta-glucosidase
MAGDEVVQMYVNYPSSSLERPLKELKGFRRIHLAGGDSTVVRFPLRYRDLTYYDTTTRGYRVEEGTVNVLIGASSADVRLTGQIHTTAGEVAATYRQNGCYRSGTV